MYCSDRIKEHLTQGVLASCLLLALGGPIMAAESKQKAEVPREELQQQLEAAQKRLDAAAREVADLGMSLSDDVVRGLPAIMLRSQRAVLGLNIGSPRTATRDDGVEVISVSPGSGAAEAGIKAGDLLTEINGKSLRRQGEESPRAKLMEAMEEVEPDAKVSLKYLRGGKLASTSVTARGGMGLAGKHMFNMPFRTFEGPGPVPRLAFSRAEGVFGAAELVPLNAKLGQYFGTDKGLLVVRAPSDARLKLEDGDVIVDIDGRVPSSPAHALRILGSYQAGEQLKLNVLRMKKRLSFDIKIPEGSRWERTQFIPADDLGFIEAVPALPAEPPPPPPPGGMGQAQPDAVYYLPRGLPRGAAPPPPGTRPGQTLIGRSGSEQPI